LFAGQLPPSGVAAFPDGHPESSSLDQDADVLVRKADVGAEFAVTQFVFDADSYVRLRDRVVARGRDLPIIPGLMPVTSLTQVRRMAEMSGTPLPAAVVSRLEAVADDSGCDPPGGCADCHGAGPAAVG